MIICESHFNNGIEIDKSQRFNCGLQRLSIRRTNGEYELYAHSYETGEDHIHAHGCLYACVEESNRLVPEMPDEVE